MADFNVQPKFETLGLPYDTNSIMHYRWNEFAIDPSKPTVLPKRKLKRVRPAKMGQRFGLSAIDVARLVNLYGCAPEEDV